MYGHVRGSRPHSATEDIYTDQDKEAWMCPLEADTFYSHFTLRYGRVYISFFIALS